MVVGGGIHLREWSLINGRGDGGGAQNGRWGASEILPLQKGRGAEKVEVVLTWELKVLATLIEGGGTQNVSSL